MKTLKIGKTTLHDNRCTSHKCRIEDKTFGYMLVDLFDRGLNDGVSLNEIAIMKEVNRAELIEIIDDKEELCLKIETSTHRIYVVVEEKEVQ